MFAGRPRLKRWLVRSSLAAFALIGLVFTLLWAATGPLGRWTVMQVAHERQLPRGLELHIEGLSGNVLSRARIERLAVLDEAGEFLVLQETELSWSALAALGGLIDIHGLSVSRMELLRRPVLTPSQASSGSPPRLRVGALLIDELHISEAVLGQSASFRIDGEGNLQQTRRVAINIQRLDAPDDFVSAQFTLSDDSQVSGMANGAISGSGPLAAVLPLDGRDIDFQARLTGTQSVGGGTAVVNLAQSDLANAAFDWNGGNWTASIDIRGGTLEELRNLPFAPRGSLGFGGTLAPFAVTTIDAQGEGWRVNAEPAGDQRAQVNLFLERNLLRQLSRNTVDAQQLQWSGHLDWQAGWVADGILEASNLNIVPANVAQLGGSLLVTRDQGQLGAYASLTGTDVQWPENFAGSGLPWIGLELNARQQGDSLLFESFELTAEGLVLAGSGEYQRESQSFAGSLEASIEQVERFTQAATGTISAELDLLDLSQRSARLAFGLDAAGLSPTQETIGQLTRELVLQGQLETDYNEWTLSSFRARGRDLLIEGRASGEGQNWQAALDAAVMSELQLASASLAGGAAMAVEASGDLDTASGTAELRTEVLEISGRELTSPRLGLEFSADRDTQSADWQLSSGTDWGELIGLGTFERDRDQLVLLASEASLGPFPFQARTEQVSGQWSARLTAENWRLNAADIEDLVVEVSQSPAGVDIATRASGVAREAFTLDADTLINDGVANVEFDAVWADIPVRTRQPLSYRFGDTPALDASLTIGEAELAVNWSAQQRLQLSLQDLPAETLFSAIRGPGTSGRIGADADLVFQEGVWTGRANTDLTGFRLRRLQAAGPVNLALTARLAESLAIDLEIESAEISGSGELVRAGTISDLREIIADAPLSGRVSLAGAIEPILALFVADTRQISGNVTTDLSIAGRVRQPVLSGESQLSDGRFRSTELGVDVDGVNANLVWETDQIILESLQAASPGDGTLNANGVAQWTETGWQADITSQFDRFNAVRRPDLNVVGSGQLEVRATARNADVTGSITIDRLDARPPDANTASFSEIEVTEINEPDGLAPRSRRAYPLFFDLTINAPGNLFVSGEMFSSEWRTDMQVFGSAVKPQINGEVILIDGRAFLLNRAFRLQDGTVTLSGGPRTAEIDLLARHSRDSLTVDARLTGPVSSPTIQLSSDPALPDDEILARLIFDRNSGQLSALETATIAAQVSGQNLFGIIGGLRRAAGLDRLDIATGTDGELVVTGGQRISDDVYLELESRGVALSSARLEWSLSPDLTLLSRLTGDTEASIALRWRAEY
ncbi:translocation/assembly module TamB domain-containing protein [Hyphobacterium sp.]|uniref:translocation/assembly module TamB domain-containing protein n=1 Tax=Hyphobacterium sp. TaxID=2004662 RepID=UPI003BAC777A